MVVTTERVMALCCPACEKVQSHVFSMFQVGSSPRPLQCDCGFIQGHVCKKGGRYELRLLCPSGERLRLVYSLREFSTAPLLSFLSPNDGEILGFLGEPASVGDATKDWQEEDDEEEFENPEVMYDILQRLQSLARKGNISCDCDDPSVGIDVYPDKVELVCAYCGSAMLMGARLAQDVERVGRLAEIVMECSSYTYLEEWLRPFYLE